MTDSKSINETRIRKITHLYYSRPDIQEAIFKFCKNREISPRYFEGFGKRPDIFQYKNDILELVKKGATSFHCSEEIWDDPLKVQTGMNPKQLNEIRTGWDFLIDIDSKYLDYSKIMAKEIIRVLNFHGIKNIGLKYSGSKGFHLLVPWKAFPKEINDIKTSDMFPEWPRIVLKYINEKINPNLLKEITRLSTPNKYIRDYEGSKEVIPDLVLVSPRHLFRTPYSLHEKTSLSSAVIDPEKINEFKPNDADPMKIKPKPFTPDSKEGEASELLMQALDWHNEKRPEQKKQIEYKSIKLSNLSEQNFPPCIQNILKGITDGKKRALFALINAFRSVGMEKDELEKRIQDWNKKNNPQLKEGYIKSQLDWTYRQRPIMPPNCKEFYQGIAVCIPDSLCNKVKNPVNYIIKKNFQSNNNNFKKKD
ncbi:DNA primase small subunit domain-containing protein [Nanoarchaeota archaeon]